MTVTGSGAHRDADIHDVDVLRRVVDEDPTLIMTDCVELAGVRRLDASSGLSGDTLTGTWSDQPRPLPLAHALMR
jgi:hypothetical protein